MILSHTEKHYFLFACVFTTENVVLKTTISMSVSVMIRSSKKKGDENESDTDRYKVQDLR